MRLLTSLAGLASDAADYAADRLDAAAENLRGEAPAAVDWQARALDAEQRLAELERLDARTPSRRQVVLIESLLDAVDRGADPATHGLDHPPGLAGRVRDALAKGHTGDEQHADWKSRALFAQARSTDYKRERDTYKAQFDTIAIALAAAGLPLPDGADDDISIGEHTSAALKTLTERAEAARNPARILEPRLAVLDAILANLRTYGLDLADGEYPDGLVAPVSAALRDRADALHQLHTIGSALSMYADKRDPMTMALKHPADTAARVAEALSVALRLRGDLDAALADSGAAAAVRIRETPNDTEESGHAE
jgi:hypothetical protein